MTPTVLWLLLGSAFAKPTSPPALPEIATDPTTPLPVDAQVRVGRLANGLTYYVEPNRKPLHRVELRLAVKAGSIVETEEERGIAHFVEHMAFNGTEHFGGNDLIAYLESLGAQFGAHLNAYTSFDETVYKLQLPTDGNGLLDSGLLVLSDWASGVTFDPDECERERGVVLEEWRLGQGLSQRVQTASLPAIFYGSHYLHRLPIGTQDTLQNLTCDAAKAFWQRWYRPELMAVAVVGDIDPDHAVERIEQLFGGLKSAPDAPERVWSSVPGHAEPQVVVFTDPEIPQGIVMLGAKVDEVERPDHGAYREFLLAQMVSIMINERLAVAAQDPSAPHIAAEQGQSSLGHLRALQSLTLLPKEGRVLEALALGARELARMQRFGFTVDELRRSRILLARNLQTYYDERDKTESAEHIEEIMRVFLTDEPMPGIPYEYALASAYLPAITVEEANAFARERLFPEDGRVVQVLLPSRGSEAPSVEAVLATLEAVSAETISAPVEEARAQALTTVTPVPGTAKRLARDRKLGTSLWQLSNGTKVLLKPTTLQADEVVLEAFSDGGRSLVSDDDYVPALTAVDIARRSGLGDHDVVALARLMTGRNAGLAPHIGRTQETLSGSASASELETLLQLVYLTFTAPRFDANALELERQGRLESLRNRELSPDSVFEDRFTSLAWQDNPRMTAWTIDDLAKLDLAASERIFRERFASPGDFTFVLVGNLDERKVMPLLNTWIGSLPAPAERETWKDDRARLVDGVHTFELPRGDTPRARVRLLFHGPLEVTPTSQIVLDAVAAVLETELMDRLREQLGGTYGVGANVGSTTRPEGGYTLRVEFECDPARFDELHAAAWEVIESVRDGRVGWGMLETLREKNARSYETALQSNAVWASSLAGLMSEGHPLRDALAFPKRNASFTADEVRDMAAHVLDAKRVIEGIQRP